MRILIYIGAIVLLIAVPVGRAVLRRCSSAPRYRPWIVVASLIALGVVVGLAPWVGRLDPPYSESPSGIIVVSARGLALTILLSCALGALGAVVMSYRNPGAP